MRRAEVGEGFRETGEPEKVELVPAGRICLRRQDAGVKTVFPLVVDPILVPALLAIFPFEDVESLVGEELDEESNGGILQVFCGRCRQWGRVECQGI